MTGGSGNKVSIASRWSGMSEIRASTQRIDGPREPGLGAWASISAEDEIPRDLSSVL